MSAITHYYDVAVVLLLELWCSAVATIYFSVVQLTLQPPSGPCQVTQRIAWRVLWLLRVQLACNAEVCQWCFAGRPVNGIFNRLLRMLVTYLLATV